MEQPLPQCWSANSVPRAFFPRVAIGCRLSLKIDRNLSPSLARGGLSVRGYMIWYDVNRRYGIWRIFIQICGYKWSMPMFIHHRDRQPMQNWKGLLWLSRPLDVPRLESADGITKWFDLQSTLRPSLVVHCPSTQLSVQVHAAFEPCIHRSRTVSLVCEMRSWSSAASYSAQPNVSRTEQITSQNAHDSYLSEAWMSSSLSSSSSSSSSSVSFYSLKNRVR